MAQLEPKKYNKELKRRKYYKIVGKDGKPSNGGSSFFTWDFPKGKRPGKWSSIIKNPVLCRRGYHLCKTSDIFGWRGDIIFEAEFKGKVDYSNRKISVSQARLVRKVLDFTNVEGNKKIAKRLKPLIINEMVYRYDTCPNKPQIRLNLVKLAKEMGKPAFFTSPIYKNLRGKICSYGLNTVLNYDLIVKTHRFLVGEKTGHYYDAREVSTFLNRLIQNKYRNKKGRLMGDSIKKQHKEVNMIFRKLLK